MRALRFARGLVALFVVAWVLSSVAMAAELPKTHVKAVGLNSKTLVAFHDEKPFWNDTIPKDSNGQVTADFEAVDVMGIQDFQVMRLNKLGVMDFAAGDISKMAGDDPVFEGCDLAGLTLTIEMARKACEAWKPTMARVLKEKFSIRLLALGTNPPQVFWCREKINGLSDLKGKKVRVFNKTMADFINAVGGTTVSMAFAEVVPALQRGVVDCAVTGSLSGNTAGWPEVSKYLYPMYLGWSINYQGANSNSWERFGPAVQGFFTTEFDKFEDRMWATAAESVTDAEHCNFNKDPCKYGKKANMGLIPVSAADKKLHKELMENVVLVNWGKRCGKPCAAEWNDSVGKVVGLQIPLNKL
jgi:TRAP-type C4-dicarboxylate transport system substrate-binding protein